MFGQAAQNTHLRTLTLKELMEGSKRRPYEGFCAEVGAGT
jgi:hypothetical protein